MAVKRVNEQGFYNLGAKQLAKKVELTVPKMIAVVDHLDLRHDQECYKEFRFGKTLHKRYSQNAIQKIRTALKKERIEDIWQSRRRTRRR